jgi:protein phosphatase PTC7
MRIFLILATISIGVMNSPATGLKFQHAVENIPFPAKKDKGGEDAYYASDFVLSVADGVGGWNQRGVDPAKYSKKLAENTERFTKSDPIKYRKNPKQMLIDVANNNKETGSSTLVIAAIDPESDLLRTSYIGDSSYLLVRIDQSTGNYIKVYRSEEQQHSFNFPFQIGSIGDNPSEALAFQHEIKENDILILGTDGMFDNLFDKDVINMLNENKDWGVEEISKALGAVAFEKSLDTRYMSPFAVGAKKAGFYFLGGKSDDITIIVAKVVRNNN